MRRSATVSARRPGVILIVVLALLALLALVGITFVLVADADRPGARQFQVDIEDLNSDTRGLAFFLAADLEQVDDGEGVDLGAYGSALARLGERAAALQDEIGRVRREATDPAVRADLERLDRDLAIYLRYLCGLAELIDPGPARRQGPAGRDAPLAGFPGNRPIRSGVRPADGARVSETHPLATRTRSLSCPDASSSSPSKTAPVRPSPSRSPGEPCTPWATRPPTESRSPS